MSDFTTLSARYVELTRSRPDRRWKESTLAAKVAEIEERNAAQAKAQAKREAEMAARTAEREARAAERGEFETYGTRQRRTDSETDYRLGRLTYWAANVIAEHEATAAQMAESFLKDPMHTMTWGEKYFTAAANYSVAQRVKSMFEYGTPVEEMLESAMLQVMKGARYPASSTSITSNLAETCETTAWSRVAGMLNGSDW